jgi:transcriptional regulator with XRE-family HTH domain
MTSRWTGSFDAGKRFQLVRRLAGDTQKQAAKRFGVSQSAVAKWENSESRIDKRHFPTLQSYVLEAARRFLAPFGVRIVDR